MRHKGDCLVNYIIDHRALVAERNNAVLPFCCKGFQARYGYAFTFGKYFLLVVHKWLWQMAIHIYSTGTLFQTKSILFKTFFLNDDSPFKLSCLLMTNLCVRIFSQGLLGWWLPTCLGTVSCLACAYNHGGNDIFSSLVDPNPVHRKLMELLDPDPDP